MKLTKSIILSQILAVIFALLANIYQEVLIHNDKIIKLPIIYFGIIGMILIYSFLMYFLSDGKCITMILVIASYIIYWFVFLIVFAQRFPTGVDDLGVGILTIMMTIYNFTSVLVGCILGTLVKRKRQVIKEG